jgi:hypothetical protein
MCDNHDASVYEGERGVVLEIICHFLPLRLSLNHLGQRIRRSKIFRLGLPLGLACGQKMLHK